MADQSRVAREALLERGREALRVGDWRTARERFRAHVARHENCAEAWEGLGWACYWLQEVAGMFEARQNAYQCYQARGDTRSAARVATWVGSDFLEFRGEAAVAAGWWERSRQLLEGLEPTVEHAWLGVIEAHAALAVRNDLAAARAGAAKARDVARAIGDTDVELLARAIEGMTLVAGGEIAEGMRRLDGAAAGALGGDMADLNAISVTCCYMIQACERVRDFERATEWCTRFREFSARRHLGSFETFCRIQYGTVLLWRGEWEAAEAELLAARDELESVRPAGRAGALARLGELRRRQGRWDEAAALLEEARTHRLAALWRAALALDQGDALSAGDLAAQALRRGPGNDADRVTALELLARSRVARGALDEAAEWLAQLESLAAGIGTESVRAAALVTAGVLARARGREEDARQLLCDAADLFEAASSPFEAGCARLELARALLAAGRDDRAQVEARAALELFEGLGAARQAGQAREVLAGASSPAGNHGASPTAGPLTHRQLEVLRLVAQGLGNREIGAQLVLSEFTVRRHLDNIYTRLGVSSRAAAVARAMREKLF